MNRALPPTSLDFVLLIPCFNNVEGLFNSIKSIYYPFNKFAVLIVDDGSQQAVNADELAQRLPPQLRINVIRLSENKGITKALNKGLQWIDSNLNTRYIARLDCGDLCEAERFTRQVELLDQNPEIDIVGTWCYFKNYQSGLRYLYRTPTGHDKIGRGMYFRNLFIHPTVMWRNDQSSGTSMYPENFPHAEDYGFFYTILRKGKGAIIPEPLVTCEINPEGISLVYRKEQLKSRIKVIRHFSQNKWLQLMGILKLNLLLGIPYPLILNTKKLLYGK